MPTIMPPVIAALLLLPRRRAPRRDKSLIQELHTDFCERSSRNFDHIGAGWNVACQLAVFSDKLPCMEAEIDCKLQSNSR